MKNPLNSLRMAPSALLVALAFTGQSLHADLVYHMPFDNEASASLANGGTAGGTATGSASLYGLMGTPTANSTTKKFGTHSEYYGLNTSNATYAGSTLLPNSTTNFRLDDTSSEMTISTWIYWDGTAESNNRYGIANLFPASQNAGWSFFINNDGKLTYAFQTDTGYSRSRETTNSVITTGSWINVGLTVDTSIAGNGAITIYVNGVAQSLTGSALSTAVTLTNSGDIAVGNVAHGSGGGGSFALNGYMDDYAMWDSALSSTQIKALNTAPTVLSDYNAGIMNQLFEAYATEGSTIVDTKTWDYTSGFDATGRSLGDTWLGEDGKYYILLDGDAASGVGMVSSIPEPRSAAMLLGILALTTLTFRVNRKRS